MKKYIIKNHRIIAEKQAQISINERGFLFGDGIFETCRIFNGKIYNFTAHKNRIKAGLTALKFSAEIDDLEKKSLQLIKKNQVKNGLLRISISRGIGSLGYLPTYKSEPLIIIQTLPLRKITAKKITLGFSTIKKPPQNSQTTSCKTAQALPYILNKISATEQKLFDCVMLSQENFISETSSANIFWVKNNQIFTPSEACDIVLGTIRDKLLKISPHKIKLVKAKISDLKNADEIFLTNTSFLILAVDELVWKESGKKISKKLTNNFTKKLLKLLQKDLTEID